MKRNHVLAVVMGLICAVTLPAQGADKISKDLAKLKDDVAGDILVQFYAAANAATLNGVFGAPGQIKKTLQGNTYLVRMPAGQAKQLAKSALVKYISPDRALAGTLDYATPAVYADYGQYYGYTGSNIGVAVIDSGVHDHPDLKDSACSNNRIVYKQSFVEGDSNVDDKYGHGTHVAGIVGGNGKCAENYSTRSRRFIGVAPAAKIVSLRVLNASGSGTDSGVIAAIDRAVELRTQYNIRVMNLSLGRGVYENCATDPLCQAVERAWKAGIVVVASAGNGGRNNTYQNQGYGTISSPGNNPYVITVGAMRDMSTVSRADDLLASYSSKGPTAYDHYVKPDIVAPGNRLVSYHAPGSSFSASSPANMTYRSYYLNGGTGTSAYYLQMSGTSMAAPMVAGAAALLLHKDPSLTPDAVKARLMKTATKDFASWSYYTTSSGTTYSIQYDAFAIGAGYLNVWAALNSYDTVPQGKYALSPRAVRGSNGVSIMHGTNSIWPGSVLWGDSTVWGSRVFLNNTSVLWGDSVVWGDASTTREGDQ